jgi:ABC-type transporter Mla MlaB component
MSKRTRAKGHAARKPRKAASPRRTGVAARTQKDAAVALSVECTAQQVPDLHKDLGALIGHRTPVTIDVSAVRRVDTPAMQVLAAFVQERRSLGLATQWRGEAQAFTAAAQLLGLEHFLGLAST